ncbi:MAG: hypothetical protein O9972_47990 [Burkholderiales bacterium]|nr:hypothetical protein [Burkholderiales bacterium]
MDGSAASTDDRRITRRALARLAEMKGQPYVELLLEAFGATELDAVAGDQVERFHSVVALALLDADGALPRRGAPQPLPGPETAATPLEAARRALLRLAVTHPDGERAVEAVLAAVGVETLGEVPPARLLEVVETAVAVQGAAGLVRH